jgi:hypothetical protein
MTYDDFYEGLRLLSQLKRQELILLQAFTEDDWQSWADFRRDPLRWLLRADDHRAAALWSAIERRRKGRRPPGNPIEAIDHPAPELNVIQFVPRDGPDRR